MKRLLAYLFIVLGLGLVVSVNAFSWQGVCKNSGVSGVTKIDFTKEKKRIKAREKKIQKMLGELNKQSFVLDPELKKKKEDRLRKEKIAFERYVQDQNAEYGKKEKEMTQKILRKMMEVIKEIGKGKSYTVILEQKVVLYHDKGNDLTKIATRTYDRTNK